MEAAAQPQQQPPQPHAAAAAATNTTAAAAAGMASPAWPLGMLEPARVLGNGLEVSVHACTRSMAREVKHIFPHLKPRAHTRAAEAAGAAAAAATKGEGEDEVLIVPTIQKSRVDTVRFGPEVEEEKDRCLEYVRAGGVS